MPKKKLRRAEKRTRHKEQKEKSMKGVVEFCKRCSSILVPQKKRSSVVMKCRRCGYETGKSVRNLKIVEEKKKMMGVIILEKDDMPLPMTVRDCPKCGNRNAWYWLQQTRSADEPPTQFFRCTRCKHVWREYK